MFGGGGWGGTNCYKENKYNLISGFTCFKIHSSTFAPNHSRDRRLAVVAITQFLHFPRSPPTKYNN